MIRAIGFQADAGHVLEAHETTHALEARHARARTKTSLPPSPLRSYAMKKLVYVALLLGVPLVCAALTASVTYAWNSFTVNPRPVYADGAGVDNAREGYGITTIHDGDVEYLVVSNYDTYTGDTKEEDKGKLRHFLTFYEVIRKSDGEAELKLVGSRCVEWDKGFELLGFKADGSRPELLRGKR
jgi:hypothetical protein